MLDIVYILRVLSIHKRKYIVYIYAYVLVIQKISKTMNMFNFFIHTVNPEQV